MERDEEMHQPKRPDIIKGTPPSVAARAARLRNNRRNAERYVQALEALGYTVTPPSGKPAEPSVPEPRPSNPEPEPSANRQPVKKAVRRSVKKD